MESSNLQPTNKMLEAALNYLSKGASVVPVSRDKIPHIKWEDFQTRQATVEEVTQWWTTWPEANVGLITGKISGLTVVDVEAGGDIDRFPITTTIQSGGGGWHLYYQYYPINNKARIFHLTDIRGDGGYVVAPPSLHSSGNEYKVIKEIPPIPFPAEIFDQEKTRIDSNVSKLLNEIVPEGGRNNTATSICGKLIATLKESEWDTIAWPLFQSWNSTHNDPPLPERELSIIFKSITQAENRKAMVGASIGEPVLIGDGEMIVIGVPIQDGSVIFEFEDVDYSTKSIEARIRCSIQIPNTKAKKFVQRINILSNSAREAFTRQLKEAFPRDKNKMSWALIFSQVCELLEQTLKKQIKVEFYDKELEVSTKYLLEPFIEEGVPNVVFGMGGSGKTYLTLRMALSLAFEKSFLGSVPSIRGNTLFIDYENTHRVWSTRISKLIKGMGFPEEDKAEDEAFNKLFYFNPKGAPMHDLKYQLLDMIRDWNIKLIIIDSAALACGGEPENADVANRLFNAIGRLNMTTLLIAHETKNSINKTETPFGSVFFYNSARNIWNIQRKAKEGEDTISVCMKHKKSNNDKIFRHREAKLRFAGDEVRMMETHGEFNEDNKVDVQILGVLEDTKTITAPIHIARVAGTTQKYVSDRLKILVERGLVTRKGYGKYVLKAYENQTTVLED